MKIIIEISEESYKNAKDGLVPLETPQIIAAGVPLEDYTDKLFEEYQNKLLEKISIVIFRTLR